MCSICGLKFIHFAPIKIYFYVDEPNLLGVDTGFNAPLLLLLLRLHSLALRGQQQPLRTFQEGRPQAHTAWHPGSSACPPTYPASHLQSVVGDILSTSLGTLSILNYDFNYNTGFMIKMYT